MARWHVCPSSHTENVDFHPWNTCHFSYKSLLFDVYIWNFQSYFEGIKGTHLTPHIMNQEPVPLILCKLFGTLEQYYSQKNELFILCFAQLFLSLQAETRKVVCYNQKK